MRLACKRLLAMAAVFLSACGSPGQNVHDNPGSMTIRWTTDGTPLPGDFGRVMGVARLGDSGVLIADLLGKILVRYVGDSARADTVPPGGGGPSDYKVPGHLWAFRGDSLVLSDLGSRRLLVIDPAGRPARSIAYVPDIGLGSPGGADRDGNLYFSYSRMELTDRAKPVVRWLPGSGAADTLTTVLGPALNERSSTTTSGKNTRITYVRTPKPFSPAETWGVRHDGTLVVARLDPYRLEWIAGDSLHTGPPLASDSLPFSREERDTIPDGEGLPAFKPPFDGRAGLVIAMDDMLLIRSFPDDRDSVRYDLLDRGAPVATIVAPAAVRIVVLDRLGALAVHTDPETGLERVVRYGRESRWVSEVMEAARSRN